MTQSQENPYTSLPAIRSIAEFRGTSVPVGVSSLGPFSARFPSSVFVKGLLVVPRSGAIADAAALSIGFTDEQAAELVADNRGGASGFAAEAAALQGLSAWRPFALQRIASAGTVWRFTMGNASGAPITLAGVYLYLERL